MAQAIDRLDSEMIVKKLENGVVHISGLSIRIKEEKEKT